MSGTIRLLTDEVIGKIAAGEVVERPAAAIKELVENSLDAGASAVTVEIRDGGISYFRVTDNGSGIRQSEIRMAFERHATSKITQSADLNAIATLGFRGEALASIAAVARVTCTTRTRDDQTGLKVQNEGGTITSIEETACPEGTTFVVRDLFYNTPVRLKFLKKATTEAGYVADVMMRMILSRADVSFRFISQGKVLYHSAGDGRLESAVYAIYGHEMLRNMREISGCEGGMVVKGYVGIGESGRSSRSHQSFFINGRYMRSGLLSAAVEEACRERVMIGKFPTCVLHLTMPYESVDVNVHPNKLEVRFQNEQAVGDALMHIVLAGIEDRDALERPTQLLLNEQPSAPKLNVQIAAQKPDGPVPIIQTKQIQAATEPVVSRAAIPQLTVKPAANGLSAQPESQMSHQPGANVLRAPVLTVKEYLSPENQPKSTTVDTVASATTPSQQAGTASARPGAAPAVQQEEAGLQTEKAVPQKPEQQPMQMTALEPEQQPMKLIGTVFNTYILVEYEDHLLMIDQHAVHERLLFDRWMKLYDTERAGQELLIPLISSVTRREQELLYENREILEKLGFVIEAFGENEVSVRTLPMLMGEAQNLDFLHDILAQLDSERGSITLERRRAAILQTACKHAVKGGEHLTDAEVRELVSRMVDEKVTPTCPHGRPLVISLSHSELDKKFRRIQ